MAERRMFSKTIVDSDMFIDMPVTARLLYYDLAMRADDDGFVNSPKKIMRMIGASEDDLRILCARQFLIPFETGVVVIRHWRIHNYIQNDRYKATIYQSEKSRLVEKTGKPYELVSNSDTECIQNGYNMDTQVRIGKDSIGKSKDSTGKDTLVRLAANDAPETSAEDPFFAEFWQAYPKKVGKGAARKAFLKLPRRTQRLLLPALLQQKKSEQWTRENGRYIPNPATWINQCRWEDDLEATDGRLATSNPFLRLIWEEENSGQE